MILFKQISTISTLHKATRDGTEQERPITLYLGSSVLSSSVAVLRMTFLTSNSVVLTQPGGGRNTSQKARSCVSNILRSGLSRFLSTL